VEEGEEEASEDEEFLDSIYTLSLLADKKYHRQRQRTATFEPAFEVGPHPGPKGARDKTVTMVSPMCKDAWDMAKKAGIWASFQVQDSLFGKGTAVILCDEWAARMNFAYDWWQTVGGDTTKGDMKAECLAGYEETQAFIDLVAVPNNPSDLKERSQKIKDLFT